MCAGTTSGKAFGGTYASRPSRTKPGSVERQFIVRKCFSRDQSSMLFYHFERQMYPSSAGYNYLALLTGLRKQQVIVWFKNQRAAFRRRLRSCLH